MPNRCQLLSQEIEAMWMSEADNNIFYLVLKLFMLGSLSMVLSMSVHVAPDGVISFFFMGE